MYTYIFRYCNLFIIRNFVAVGPKNKKKKLSESFLVSTAEKVKTKKVHTHSTVAVQQQQEGNSYCMRPINYIHTGKRLLKHIKRRRGQSKRERVRERREKILQHGPLWGMFSLLNQ